MTTSLSDEWKVRGCSKYSGSPQSLVLNHKRSSTASAIMEYAERNKEKTTAVTGSKPETRRQPRPLSSIEPTRYFRKWNPSSMYNRTGGNRVVRKYGNSGSIPVASTAGNTDPRVYRLYNYWLNVKVPAANNAAIHELRKKEEQRQQFLSNLEEKLSEVEKSIHESIQVATKRMEVIENVKLREMLVLANSIDESIQKLHSIHKQLDEALPAIVESYAVEFSDRMDLKASKTLNLLIEMHQEQNSPRCSHPVYNERLKAAKNLISSFHWWDFSTAKIWPLQNSFNSGSMKRTFLSKKEASWRHHKSSVFLNNNTRQLKTLPEIFSNLFAVVGIFLQFSIATLFISIACLLLKV